MSYEHSVTLCKHQAWNLAVYFACVFALQKSNDLMTNQHRAEPSRDDWHSSQQMRFPEMQRQLWWGRQQEVHYSWRSQLQSVTTLVRQNLHSDTSQSHHTTVHQWPVHWSTLGHYIIQSSALAHDGYTLSPHHNCLLMLSFLHPRTVSAEDNNTGVSSINVLLLMWLQ